MVPILSALSAKLPVLQAKMPENDHVEIGL